METTYQIMFVLMAVSIGLLLLWVAMLRQQMRRMKADHEERVEAGRITQQEYARRHDEMLEGLVNCQGMIIESHRLIRQKSATISELSAQLDSIQLMHDN